MNFYRDKCLDRQHPVRLVFRNQQRFLEHKYLSLLFSTTHSTLVLRRHCFLSVAGLRLLLFNICLVGHGCLLTYDK